MLLLKLLGVAFRAILEEIWLGVHFIYGCVEGTVRAVLLILRLRWQLRKHRRAGRKLNEASAVSEVTSHVDEDLSELRERDQ